MTLIYKLLSLYNLYIYIYINFISSCITCILHTDHEWKALLFTSAMAHEVAKDHQIAGQGEQRVALDAVKQGNARHGGFTLLKGLGMEKTDRNMSYLGCYEGCMEYGWKLCEKKKNTFEGSCFWYVLDRTQSLPKCSLPRKPGNI